MQAWPSVTRVASRLYQHKRVSTCSDLKALRHQRLHTSPASFSPSKDHGSRIPHDTREVPTRKTASDINVTTSELVSSLRKLEETPATPSALRVAKASDIALTLGRQRQRNGHDLLLHLFQNGQIRQVVSIIDHLVTSLWTPDSSPSTLPPRSPFDRFYSLDLALEEPASLDLDGNKTFSPSLRLLDEAEAGPKRHDHDHASRVRTAHGFLGQVWRSLGNIIIVDSRSGRPVAPEILEVIAILHRTGVMPETIYHYSPDQSENPTSQPPTLSLLSSQILTNLSHATWNARQAAAVAKSKSKPKSNDGHVDPEGPELPSADYRVRVSSVRHEIWLELVLWSCLHGGWAAQGASILEQIAKEESPAWSPLSWREVFFPMVKVGSEGDVDWGKVNFLFTTGIEGRQRDSRDETPKVEKTISTEIISAYVDAISNSISTNEGPQRLQLKTAVKILHGLRKFLRKNNLSLESTSWDAVIQRLLESRSLDAEETPDLIGQILSLSSEYGEEESSSNLATRDETWRPLAPYLVDGTALSIGVWHRLLAGHVRRGNFLASFRTFRSLQNTVDQNKQRSLESFFSRLKEMPQQSSDGPGFDFKSRSPALGHPGLFTMLPPMLLANLLDLTTEVGAHDFGSWLLASKDVDGPVVDSSLLRDRRIIPAVLRFLSSVPNQGLLDQLTQSLQNAAAESPLTPNILLALLESQMNLKDYNGMRENLNDILSSDTRVAEHSEILTALVARCYLRGNMSKGDVSVVLERVFFGDGPPDIALRNTVAALLMPLGTELKQACLTRSLPRRLKAAPSVRAFNIVLDGLVGIDGSESGKQLVSKFYRFADTPMDSSSRVDDGDSDNRHADKRPLADRSRQTDIDFVVDISKLDSDAPQPDKIAVWGRFIPDISTIRIVLRKRLQEIREHMNETFSRQRDASSRDTSPAAVESLQNDPIVTWCREMLITLGMQDEDVGQELTGSLQKLSMSRKSRS